MAPSPLAARYHSGNTEALPIQQQSTEMSLSLRAFMLAAAYQSKSGSRTRRARAAAPFTSALRGKADQFHVTSDL